MKQTLITKKRRGPAPTGVGTLIGVRLQPPELAALDEWIAAQPEPRPSRPEALRRLAAAEIGTAAQMFLPGQVLMLNGITAADLLNLHPDPKPRISLDLFGILRGRQRSR